MVRFRGGNLKGGGMFGGSRLSGRIRRGFQQGENHGKGNGDPPCLFKSWCRIARSRNY